METGTLIAIMAIIYMAISFGLGFYFMRWQKSLGAFFTAGRGLNPIVVGITTLASYSSGWTFVGSPGLTYAFGFNYGHQFGYIPLIYSVTGGAGGYMAQFIIIGKKMRIMADTHGCMNISDATYARYRSNTIRVWVSLGVILGTVPYLATQVMALGTMMSTIFGLGFWFGAILGMAIVAVYAVVGGIFAVVYTDVFQGTCMGIYGIALAIILYSMAGGPGKVYEALYEINPLFVRPQGLYTATVILVAGAGLRIVSFHPPAIVRMYMVRKVSAIKWTVLVGVIMGSLVFLPDTFGWPYRALQLYQDAPAIAKGDQVMPTIMLNYMPGLVAGVAFSGVLAATMSNVDSFLNFTAAELMKGILYGAMGIRVRPRTEVLLARIFTASYILVALGFAATVFEMIGILGGIGNAMMNTLCIQPLFGLIWTRVSKKNIYVILVLKTVGMAGTFAYLQGWFFKLPFGIYPHTMIEKVIWPAFFILGFVFDGRKEVPADFDIIMRIPFFTRPTLKVPVVAPAEESGS